MTEQTNGQDEKHEARSETAQALAVKAQHRHDMAVLDEQAMRGAPLALQVLLDERKFNHIMRAAEMLANAHGFVPRHLAGKTEACFAITIRAITTKQDPYALACATYQTPDGKVGYEGSAIQSMLESSSRFRWSEVEYNNDGSIKPRTAPFEYLPSEDVWLEKVQARFHQGAIPKANGQGTYRGPIADWKDEDEEGLGIRYRFHIDGGPRQEWTFWLKQAVIRNSTLWPTDPMTQCHYAGVRRLAKVKCPSILMGIPDPDTPLEVEMRDVTPPPAPPPVDLTTEGIRGAGRMTVEDEAAQDGGPKTAERIDPETGEVLDTAAPERGKRRGRPPGSKNKPKAEGGESDEPAGESPARQQATQEQSFDHAEMPGDTTPPGPADMIDRGEQQAPDDEDMPNLGF